MAMFLNKKYILANELVEKMGIHIANISMLAKQFEDNDYGHVIKMNNCTFINSESRQLPHNIEVGLFAHKYTDISNKLPCTFVKSEFEVTEREWFKSGIVTDKVTIAGKKFYVFNDNFVKTMKRKVPYVLDSKETNECMAKGQIEGSIKLSKNKFFVWY
jgi:hypothetical protein